MKTDLSRNQVASLEFKEYLDALSKKYVQPALKQNNSYTNLPLKVKKTSPLLIPKLNTIVPLILKTPQNEEYVDLRPNNRKMSSVNIKNKTQLKA